jgi:CHAT domain-containing protein/tetratricopeptide (TPR) repeat protein
MLVKDYSTLNPSIAMPLQRITLTALLTLAATLTISDFPLIQTLPTLSKGGKISNSWVLAQSSTDRKAEADRLWQQGLQQSTVNQWEAASQFYKQALAIYREIGDRQGEGQMLMSLGTAATILGNYAQALEYHQQSLTIMRQIGNRLIEAYELNTLGSVYSILGDEVKTLEYYQQSLAVAREIKNRQVEGATLQILGAFYVEQGEYAQGISFYQQSLAVAREARNPQGEAIALAGLANAYVVQGNQKLAIESAQQWIAIKRELGDRMGEGIALAGLGSAYFNQGDFTHAIEYQQQYLAISREQGNRGNEYSALENLANAYYAQGDYKRALEFYQQRLALARKMGEPVLEGYSLADLGNVFFATGKLSEAKEMLLTAIKIRESQRQGLNDANKVSIFERQADNYRLLQQVLIAQNQPEAALEIAERGRGRAFVDLLAKQLSPNPTEGTSLTPPTIEQIKQIAKAQKATLVQYSIITDVFKVQGKQEQHDSELYIWVIKPTGEVAFRRSDLKSLWQCKGDACVAPTTLADLVTSSRESIGVRGRGGLGAVARVDGASLAKQLQQLHQLLIEPIADLLPTDPNARVIFLPQRSLFLVPFPALQDKQGKYLIEKHTILSAPSIQVLELTHKERQRVGANGSSLLKDALVVGNPTMPSVPGAPGEKPQQLPPLPGAEQEAQEIAPLLNTKAIVGKDATKSAIKQLMPSARIIHLATHGLLDDVRGIGSAIALAPSGNDDGLLTAEQILDLKLNASLVVLSACNTGRGRITGDGVIGLSRSLISAGVPSVLVSLWSVPDAPTASLMVNFYQNLQKHPDKAQALRQAMLTTMKQHPNPRNWAAFTLIGEAE